MLDLLQFVCCIATMFTHAYPHKCEGATPYCFIVLYCCVLLWLSCCSCMIRNAVKLKQSHFFYVVLIQLAGITCFMNHFRIDVNPSFFFYKSYLQKVINLPTLFHFVCFNLAKLSSTDKSIFFLFIEMLSKNKWLILISVKRLLRSKDLNMHAVWKSWRISRGQCVDSSLQTSPACRRCTSLHICRVSPHNWAHITLNNVSGVLQVSQSDCFVVPPQQPHAPYGLMAKISVM